MEMVNSVFDSVVISNQVYKSLWCMRTKKLFTSRNKIHILVVDDRRSADQFIDFGVALSA